MALSLHTCFTLIAAAFVFNSLSSVWELFSVPDCRPNDRCIFYYLSENDQVNLLVLTSINETPNKEDDVSFQTEIKLIDHSVESSHLLKIKVPRRTRNNGTLFVHFVLMGRPPNDFEATDFVPLSHVVYPVTIFAVPIDGGFDLIGGRKTATDADPVTHVKKTISLRIVSGLDKFPSASWPAELEKFKRVNGLVLMPIMHVDSLSDRLSNLVRYNGSDEIQITVNYSPSSLGRLRFMIMSEMTLSSVKDYGFTDSDLDQIKGIFSGDKIYLFCVTVVVSGLHILFDLLSIKNDVEFWRSRKTLAGLSKKTVIWRAFSQSVVFLYLANEKSSLLITLPAFASVIIELWKVSKVIGFKRSNGEGKSSDAESETENFDAQGMKYVLCVLAPLVILGAIYSLLYVRHKNWYSWTISSLVNGVYAFGFLFMLPQLFINYKMKSVAQLPWKAFTYKAFNTFVDDLFAFIIDMPTAHRIACFRDDVVFVVYLYQRWLYPVDKNRIDSEETVDETGIFSTQKEIKFD